MSSYVEYLPDSCDIWLHGPLRDVAALLWDGVAPFEIGVLCEAFGVDRTDDGVPLIDFAICAPQAGGLCERRSASPSMCRTASNAWSTPT